MTLKRILIALALTAPLVALGGGAPDQSAADEIADGIAWPTHLPYPPDLWERMVPVENHYLKPAAARAFRAMAEAAREDGVHLLLRSAWRSRAHQSRLFFGGAKARGISLTERARVSAPPGYSEHHTGYAVDIDDGRDPRFLRPSFDQTRASAWLMANAQRFCFELSFPRGNPQGINYEPWHWRFVGTLSALRTFAPARVRYPGLPASHIVGMVPGDDGALKCRGPEDEETATVARQPRPDQPAPPPPVTPASLVGR